MAIEITLEKVYSALQRKGYKIFETDDFKPFNMNLVGIRTNNNVPNTFDDWFCMFYKHLGNWYFDKMKCTTDPGLYYLQNPLNVNGTSILKEGQYIDSYQLGLHKGRYVALVQRKPVTVIRDTNKNSILDLDGKEDTGLFGINVHAASLNPQIGESEYIKHIVKPKDTLYSLSNFYKTSIDEIKELNNLTDNTILIGDSLIIKIVSNGTTAINIGKWSGGCVVIQDTTKYNKLISTCQKAADIRGNEFTLTLINEKDL